MLLLALNDSLSAMLLESSGRMEDGVSLRVLREEQESEEHTLGISCLIPS